MQDIATMVEDVKRDKIISKHENKVWQGKNGMWYTYIYVGGKRKLVKRKDRKSIECMLYDIYKPESQDEHTIERAFEVWLDSKEQNGSISPSTVARYETTYKSYVKPIGKNLLEDMTEWDIEEFVCDIVNEGRLTAKELSGLKTILRGIFRYAKKKGYVQFRINEVLEDVEISNKKLRKSKKDVRSQVFIDEEYV